MSKKRLVYLSAFLSPYRSGAEAMVEEVSKRLKEEFDITIITGRYDKRLPKNDIVGGIPVIRVGIGHPADKWLYPFLAPLQLGALKPDIVHAVLETFAGLALYFCRCKAKKILTLQTTNRSFLKKLIIRHPDIVTAISSSLLTIAAELGRKDVILIPNGIDTKLLAEALAFHTKIPGRILFVGRLEPMKGVDTLLTAYAKLLPTAPLTADLRIVGDGSLRKQLESLATSLGISHRVTFTGKLSPTSVAEEYAQAEIFCGLSRSEALGNVFLEAGAAGCAVVATNIGGIPEIVKDGETGLLVSPDDVGAASLAIMDLLKNDSKRSALASAAQQNAQTYDWSTVAASYRKILAE